MGNSSPVAGASALLAVLLLVAGCAAAPQPPAAGQPAIAPTIPAGSPQAQAASTPVPAPTPTALPTPLPPPQPFAPLLFDDFSQLSSGWTPLFVDQQGAVNGYSVESFAFSTATPGRLLFNLLPRLSLAPTGYNVEIEPVEGAGMFGLLLEVRGDPADYAGLAFFGVGLNSAGSVLLLVKGAGADLQVIPLAEGAGAAPQAGRPIRLSVARFADRLTVSVDGAAPLAVAAPAPEGGAVGFFARADDRLAVRFDNLLLTTGEPGSDEPCARIRPLFDRTGQGEAIGGDDVALVQRRLALLGYNPGDEAAYGPLLATAVARFQAANDLPADGVVEAQTWCRLLSGAAIVAGVQASEREALRGRYRPVTFLPEAGLPAPLFVSVRGDERRWQIALALPGRSSLHYVDTGGDALDPAWQPDRGLLAFSSLRAGDEREAIWILDTTDGGLTRISPSSLNAKYPAWSPDGRTLIFTGQPVEGNDKQARNYRYSTVNGEVTPWGALPAGWSDWSPVGTVVFTRWTGRSFDIFAANADGSGEVNLTNSDDYHEDIPAWSPAGDQIAFVRNPKAAPDDRQLYVMQADGSDVRAVTTLPGPNSNPIWLDATTIVFANQPDEEVRRPYILRLPDDVRPLSTSDERVWFLQRFGRGP